MRALVCVVLIASTCGCDSRGLPIGKADGGIPRDLSATEMQTDLSLVRPDLAVSDLALPSLPADDLAVPDDLAFATDMSMVNDLARSSCSLAIDCPSYVCVSGQCAPRYNDDCADAIQLDVSGGSATAYSLLTFATNSNQASDASPTCSSDARSFGQDAVYYFDLTTTVTRMLIAEWDPNAFGTLSPVLYVRRNTCGSPAASDEVACASTNGGPNQAFLDLENPALGRYYVWVDSRAYMPTTFNVSVTFQ